MPDPRRARRRLVRALRVAVAAGLVAWLVWRSGISVETLRGLDPGWLLGGLVMVPVSLGLRALSLGLLLNREKVVLRPVQLYLLTLVGAGLGLVLPTGASDLAKARYGLVEHGHAEEMVVSSVVDKLTSLTAVAILGAVAALASGDVVLAVAASCVAAAAVVPIASSWARPWHLLVRLLAPRRPIDPDVVARHARPSIGVLTAVYAVSLAGWIVTYGIVYTAAQALHARLSLASVLAAAPLATIARLVPLSIGGLGLGEVTIAALLTRAGATASMAARIALLQMVLVSLLPGVAGLVVYAVRPSTRERDD